MRTRTIIMYALFSASMCTQTLCATKFTLRELSVPPSAKGATAVAINDRGDIVGYSRSTRHTPDGDFDSFRAVLWQDGKLIDLSPSEDATESKAAAINDKGDVLVNCGEYRAYLWSNGKFRNLGSLPGYRDAIGLAINNKGQVAGICTKANGAQKPFIWANGKMKALRMPPKCTLAWIVGMNDKGVILGGAEEYETHAYWVLWDGPKMKIIDSPNGLHFNGINNNGLMIGSLFKRNGKRNAVVWQDGKLKRLLPPKGLREERANAINDRGWVAGNALSGDKFHALVWLQKEVVDLSIPGRETRANGINQAGTIVGVFTDANGNFRPATWVN